MSSPPDPPEIVVLLAGPPPDLRAVQEVLRGAGFESHVIPPSGGAGKGWSTTMWLAVARHDAEAAAAVLQRHLDAGLTEEERRAAQTVVDLDAEETTCPACQSTFPTADVSRCPECGLNFG